MARSGVIEKVVRGDRFIDITVNGHEFRIPPSTPVSRDLKAGDSVVFESVATRWWQEVTSIERKETADEAESSKRTNAAAEASTQRPQTMPVYTSVELIPLQRLRPNSWNPNELVGEEREALKQDMAAGGPAVIDPILARPVEADMLEIIDGETRWRIAVELKWPSIRVVIQPLTEDQAKILCYRKNRERGTINPLKEAKLFKADLVKGLSQERIADKYGISQPQVNQRLQLLGQPEAVQEQIITRVITPSHAEVLARVPNPDRQVELARQVAEGDLSVRELEELVREERPAPAKAREPGERVPQGEKIDTGPVTCPVCNAHPHLLHRPDGRHEVEEVKEL